MSLKEIIYQLVQIVLFLAFPTIWGWIMRFLPWWPLPAQDTLNLLIYLGITLAAWILALLGVKRFVTQLRTRGLAADVKA